MELTLPKSKGRAASNDRQVMEYDLYVGSRSVKTNSNKRSKGQATVRVVFPNSIFGILQLRAFLNAKLETGKFYHVSCIADVTTNRDQTQRIEIAEILTATEIEGFAFEGRHITYVQPAEEVEAAPEAEELAPSID